MQHTKRIYTFPSAQSSTPNVFLDKRKELCERISRRAQLYGIINDDEVEDGCLVAGKNSKNLKLAVQFWTVIIAPGARITDESGTQYPEGRLTVDKVPKGKYCIGFVSKTDDSLTSSVGVPIALMLLGRVNIMDAEEAPVPDGQSSIQLVFNVRGKSAYSEPFSTMRDYGKMTRWHLAYVVCEKIVKFLITQRNKEIKKIWEELKYVRLAGIVKRGQVYRVWCAHFKPNSK